MVYVLKKDASQEEINALKQKIAKRRKTKGVNTLKYCGVINLHETPLAIQKRLRDEW